MDQKSFAIIIALTTIVSYLIIRKFFKIAPRYLMYGILGVIIGIVAGIVIAWPFSAFLGQFGIIVAPYILGLILLVFVEFFIIEGKYIFVLVQRRFSRR